MFILYTQNGQFVVYYDQHIYPHIWVHSTMPRTPSSDIPNTPKTQTHLYDVDLFLVPYGAEMTKEPYRRHKRGSLCDYING